MGAKSRRWSTASAPRCAPRREGMSGDAIHRGGCACGAVRFAVAAPIPAGDACHCHTCRRVTGHFLVSADVPREAVAIEGEARLRWWHSTDRVRRGFCATCGSTLFWDPIDRDWMGIALGAFDCETGAHIALHVHVGEKGDYYRIDDGVPCFDTVPPR